ncbi:MAG: glutamate--tRNA ligase [Oscillospiraceae bacterium]|jgi:glutamyl-tRNA synthetase|nr:glutamate--tRNA ligase [Oscillospiraceae bacterium]
MTNLELVQLIFPDISLTVEDCEARYPARELPEGACVTRFAPSPTGFVHIGNFMPALISYVLAKRSGGVFFLRNEDTDKKREVGSALRLIMETLAHFGILPDEYEADGQTVGDYGPYVQSERKEIYHACLKRLVERGRAYPCFCAPDKLDALRASQEAAKQRTGYYGTYAVCRDLSNDERAARIRKGDPFVLRLLSEGHSARRVRFRDGVRGETDFPENDQDIVIMKTGWGLPTYHFAHAVDDHFMRTTLVVRGEEWLPSVPVHLELFRAFGWCPPAYIHHPLILKRDQDDPSCVRKISKRKDPEALMEYYIQKGYPIEAVVDALMTIINSNFEDWRTANPGASFLEFPFSPRKISVSGAFFDLDKLDSISRERLSRLPAVLLRDLSCAWAEQYNPILLDWIRRDEDYYTEILNIEREQPKPRKDVACFCGIPDYLWYMYDDVFEAREKRYQWNEGTVRVDAAEILDLYLAQYYCMDSQEAWFGAIKELCTALGFAAATKDYKKNPGAYRGSLVDVTTILRVAATSLRMTFDLYSIMRLLGPERLRRRFDLALETL